MRLLEFGKFKGKSFEWIFFNVPWYVQWLHTEDIEGRWTWYIQGDEVYFTELYRRASHVHGGACDYCKERPFTRMVLLTSHCAVCCDECQYWGGAPVQYIHPSFFVPDLALPRYQQLYPVDALKRVFIGDGRLTQKKMEAFFHDDRYFPDATDGFFDQVEVEKDG